MADMNADDLFESGADVSPDDLFESGQDFQEPSPESLPQSQDISKTESFLRGGGQGVTAGFQDELSAMLAALLPRTETDVAKEEGSQNKGYLGAMAERYRQAREGFRSDNQAAQEANPLSYGAGEISGGVLQAALPVGAAGTAASTAGKIAQGAKVGAAYGGAAGLGYNQEDLTEDVSLDKVGRVAEDVAKSAAIGGALGGAIPAVVAGGKGIANLVRNTDTGAEMALAKNLGEKGESIIGRDTRLKVEGQAVDLADKIAKNVDDLKINVGDKAAAKINNAYEGALKQVGEDLGLQKQALFDFIEGNRTDIGEKIGALYKQAEASGTQVNVKDILVKLRDELQETVFRSDVDASRKQQIIQNLNKFLSKEGTTLKVDTSKLVGPSGEPLSVKAKVGGKDMSLEELKQMTEGRFSEQNPLSASIEAQANAKGANVLEKSATEISTPAVEKGPLSIGETRQLRDVLGNEAQALTGEPQALLSKGRQDVSEALKGSVGGDIAPLSEKYSTIKRIFDEIGEPLPDFVDPKVKIPPTALNKLSDKIGKATLEGDKVEAKRLFDALRTIDNEAATTLESKITGLSESQAALKSGLNKDVAQKSSILSEQGKLTPELSAEAKAAEDVSNLSKQVGDTSKIDKVRNFVDMIGSDDVAKARDAEKMIVQIEQHNPELAAELRSSGKDLSKKAALIGKLAKAGAYESGYGLGSIIGNITKGPVKLANIYGMGKKSVQETLDKFGVGKSPLTKLKGYLDTTPGSLESLNVPPKYAETLREAAGRGKAALASTNFILSQFPEYREAMENKELDKANEDMVESSKKVLDKNESTPLFQDKQVEKEESMPQDKEQADVKKMVQVVKFGSDKLLNRPEIQGSVQVKALLNKAFGELEALSSQGLSQVDLVNSIMQSVGQLSGQLEQMTPVSPQERAAQQSALKNLQLFKQTAESKIGK